MEITTCQFNDSYFPIMDGVGMTAHNYALKLNGKYGTTSLVAPKIKEYQDRVPYKVYRFKSVVLPGMNPYRIGLPLVDVRFKKKMTEKSFELFHAHCPFVSGQYALQLAGKRTIPLVTTFHSKYKEDFRHVVNNEMIVDFLMKYTLDFYHRADYVWVPNQATGRTLKEYGYQGSYAVVPNGTDMQIPSKGSLIKYRKKGYKLAGVDGEKFLFLFVGQHRWEKNVKLILDAIHLLKKQRKNFTMVFAGEGYALREMKRLVREYRLAEYVIFLGTVSSRDDLRNLYAASDLLIFPSIYDNSPLVIQEAAAFDVPAIVVQESNSAEGIVDGINGFLIENTSRNLAAQLVLLMDHPELIKRAGEGARKSLHKSWDTIVEEVYHLYREILQDYRERPDSV